MTILRRMRAIPRVNSAIKAIKIVWKKAKTAFLHSRQEMANDWEKHCDGYDDRDGLVLCRSQ